MKSLAYVLLILICFTFDMISDIYLRSHHITGVSPHSWDVVTSLGIGIGAALLIMDRK